MDEYFGREQPSESRMFDWAKREVELALEKEKENEEDGIGFEYTKGCYESALKAYASLCEDGHSGFSFGITTDILIRLINKRPLTPILDKPDEWVEAWKEGDGIKHYQHKRLSSLFKDVYPDGTVKYNDVHAYECIDEDTNIPYHGGGAGDIFNEYFPITFPYYPPVKPYRLVTREYLSDRKNGDFDTKVYKYILTPEGKKKGVLRYFGETEDGWKEIAIPEFMKRVIAHYEREKREKRKE